MAGSTREIPDRWARQGIYFLSGRIDHLLNVGGNKIDPRLIEELLDGQPEIIESAVVVVTRDTGVPVLVAAVEAQGPFDSEALKRLCQKRLGKDIHASCHRTDRCPAEE